MKFIPRRLHIVFDLCYIVFLLVFPLLFVDYHGLDTITLLVSGLAILCYSLLSKYEVGIFKLVNMSVRLAIDFMLGLVLAASPWVFNFGQHLIWPHITVGVLMMLTAVCTSNKSVKISQQEKSFTF